LEVRKGGYSKLGEFAIVWFVETECLGSQFVIMVKIAVASESRVKLGAVEAAYPGATVVGYKCESGVNPQPLTRDETRTGANNRLTELKTKDTTADIWISIENGIFNWIEGSEVCVDQACILVESKDVGVKEIWSEALVVPKALVKESADTGGKKTVGEILVERKEIQDHANPHPWLAKNPAKTRQALLESVLKARESDPLEVVRSTFGVHKNFPKAPITFFNVLPAFRDVHAFKYLVDGLVDKYNTIIAPTVNPAPAAQDLVFLALESRGFLIAPAIALKLGATVGVIRKENKLPGIKKKVEYKKEYGADVFEIAEGTITPTSKVVLVDDLVATGGTLKAATTLVKEWGGQVIGVLTIVDLVDLHAEWEVPLAALFGF
jgi:adenine phosphoribosyltransferase